MRELVAIAKALSDESRIRALCALQGRELCVCQITALIGLAPSTVSKHMAVLDQSHLVESRKEGRWIYYRSAGKHAPKAAKEALKWLFKNAADTERASKDAAVLKKILKCDREVLCRKPTKK